LNQSNQLLTSPDSLPFNQVGNNKQKDCSDEGYDEREQERRGFAEPKQTRTELLEKESADKTADNSDNEISRPSQSSAVRKRTGHSTRYQADGDKQKISEHRFPSISSINPPSSFKLSVIFNKPTREL
jgi:hypothetical protein